MVSKYQRTKTEALIFVLNNKQTAVVWCLAVLPENCK